LEKPEAITRLLSKNSFRRRVMALKGIFKALLCTTLLAWSGVAAADEYRPDEFLTLDLRSAALSAKLLGPPTQFEPVAARTKTEPAKTVPAKAEPAKAEPAKAEAAKTKPVKAGAGHAALRTATAKAGPATPVRAAKRQVAVRTKLARRHNNPLDAQAFDARIQVWPCRGGGICNWRR
jgi:hypothetical protein